MDYAERTRPEVFKPLADQAFFKLAQYNGADPAAVSEILDRINAAHLGSYWYVKTAAEDAALLIYQGKVEQVLSRLYSWSVYLFELPGSVPSYAGKSVGDERYKPRSSSVFLEDYPEEAHEALAYNLYIAGGEGNVMGVWLKDGINKIFRAHYTGFIIVAEDPVEWLEKVVDEVLQAG